MAKPEGPGSLEVHRVSSFPAGNILKPTAKGASRLAHVYVVGPDARQGHYASVNIFGAGRQLEHVSAEYPCGRDGVRVWGVRPPVKIFALMDPPYRTTTAGEQGAQQLLESVARHFGGRAVKEAGDPYLSTGELSFKIPGDELDSLLAQD